MPRYRPFLSCATTLLVLTLAPLFAGCGGGEEADAHAGGAAAHGNGKGGPGGQPPVPVAVERVREGRASSYYTATATLEAESHARILSRTTGVVREILREEGDVVHAGDVLLRLEDDEARWRIQQAEANLMSARADHDRGAQMAEGELLSTEEFEIMQNTLRVREAELELARLDYSYTKVASPFSGRVVRRLVDLGENVTPGTALYEVMDVMPLLARVHVPARRMGFVAVGQEMEIRLDSVDTPLTGRVSLVSPIVDPATGTVKVTAEIEDYPVGTRAGDFAQVRIVTARHERATLVPSRAVFEDQGAQVLYVVVDGSAERRVIEAGFIDGDDTEIVSGVTPGELVVLKGQRQLREGGNVEILEGPPDVLAAVEEEKQRAEAEAGAEASDKDGAPDAS